MVRRIVARLRIDLTDFPASYCPTQSAPLGPDEPRVSSTTGRRNRGEHLARLRIDFLDAILGDLVEMSTVERALRMRGEVDRTQNLPVRRIEGVQPVSAGEPDALSVERDAVHCFDARKGSVFMGNFA